MTKVRSRGPVAGFSGAMGEMVFADPAAFEFYSAIAGEKGITSQNGCGQGRNGWSA